MSVPQQVQDMIQQVGTGLGGGFVYVGAGKIFYTCKHETGRANSIVHPNGTVEAPVSIVFPVNGKRGEGWKIIINVEASDTYKVYLWKPIKLSLKKTCKLLSENKMCPVGEVLDSAEGIYCDMLQSCVEQMYDKAIKERNGSFIPLD